MSNHDNNFENARDRRERAPARRRATGGRQRPTAVSHDRRAGQARQRRVAVRTRKRTAVRLLPYFGAAQRPETISSQIAAIDVGVEYAVSHNLREI